MKNQSKITGDNNINIQDTKNSKISINDKIENKKELNKLWLIIPIIIALIGLIIQILVGWEQLIPWLNVK